MPLICINTIRPLRQQLKTMPTIQKQTLIAAPRPYTAYNVFFQLEREYILQTTLEVFPSFELSEIFHLDSEVYEGPPLPSRYSELILHREWHVPGKGRRIKRSHRASHGKIGFKELSKQIAMSWAVADGETKQFCKACSEYCKLQYKAILSNMKTCERIKEGCQVTKAAKSSDSSDDAFISTPELTLLVQNAVSPTTGRAPPFAEQTTCTNTMLQISDTSEPSGIISTEEVNVRVDSETFTTIDREENPMQENPETLNEIIIDTLFANLPLSVYDEAFVDMEDNKILELWHSIHHWNISPAF